MFEYVSGELKSKKPTQAVLDVQGLGYSVLIPTSSFDRLPRIGERVRLFTYLHVREDLQQLYGFVTTGERALFELMIGVSGIGPRIALAALSTMSPRQLQQYIAGDDPIMLQRISGVGRKTAERMVVELRDRVNTLALEAEELSSSTSAHADALAALETLGYSRAKAEQLLRRVVRQHPKAASADELIRLVLSL